MTGDEYEKIFGTVEEDGSKKVVAYSLPTATIEKIKRAAVAAGKPASEVLAGLVEKHL